MYRRFRLPLAPMIAALALAGCATNPRVYSFLERGADLSRYHSYTWAPPDRQGTGDPRLDNNEIFQEKVQSAVDARLASKGFEKTSGSADLLVHYHASVEQRIDLQTSEPYTPCDGCKPFIYDAGTLVIDLVDARTNRLLWRGWAEGNVEGVVDRQQWMDERVDADVTRILDTLPKASTP
jgi:hypothetical protein